MSESFSSGAEELVTNTEKSLDDMRGTMSSELEDMVRKARRWIRRMAITAIVSAALLTALFGWVMLQKILPTILP